MLGEASVIGFIPVTDLLAAKRFYGGKLGLHYVGNDGYALALMAAGGAMLRCVRTADAKPAPFTIFGWEVPDVHAALANLSKADISPIVYPHLEQDDAGVWTAPDGSQVAWFHDPDGNVLSVSHHSAKNSGQAAPAQ